jgi:methionyl-tRNA formyltransferase
MQKKIVIASSKKWFFKSENVKKLVKKNKFIILKNKNQITLKHLKKINPDFIFFPHWSHKVNQKIVKKYNCICFHTAPLPYGRGGSPIQNMILKKFKKSPVCAIQMTNKIDSGPIYLKKMISLSGDLEDIFIRISFAIVQMIKVIIKRKITPKKQIGKVFNFKRIKKKQSEIKIEKNINEIFDKIRMLSAEEYPNAYIKKNNFKIFFTKPIKKNNTISCNAKILKID